MPALNPLGVFHFAFFWRERVACSASADECGVPRPMTGLLGSLSSEARKAALAYDGLVASGESSGPTMGRVHLVETVTNNVR